MDQNTDSKQICLGLITRHFGSEVAKLYAESFATKTEQIALIITRELLSEYMGEEQAVLQMGELNKKIEEYENAET